MSTVTEKKDISVIIYSIAVNHNHEARLAVK